MQTLMAHCTWIWQIGYLIDSSYLWLHILYTSKNLLPVIVSFKMIFFIHLRKCSPQKRCWGGQDIVYTVDILDFQQVWMNHFFFITCMSYCMLPGLPKIFLSLNWFCRNVPFDIHEESLEDEFSEYGKINHVKIVVNPKTGQPKGKVRNLLYIYILYIYCILQTL